MLRQLTGVITDDSVGVQPLRHLVVKGLVKDNQHGHEESRQTGVIDDVK